MKTPSLKNLFSEWFYLSDFAKTKNTLTVMIGNQSWGWTIGLSMFLNVFVSI